MNLLPSLFNRSSTGFPDITRLHQEMDQLFNSLMSGVGSEGMRSPMATEGRPGMMSPRVRMRQGETHMLLSFEVPGVQRDDINIECRNGQLIVSANRRDEDEASSFIGTYHQAMSLPEGTDVDQIEAHYENGILYVAIPRANAREEARRIQIQDQQPGFMQRLLGKMGLKDESEMQTTQSRETRGTQQGSQPSSRPTSVRH